ncbi:GDSL-type esterase/lipase family protein [Shinella sp. M31]|uniref:GDSL-type esterase/lipase family protein n=1 Tax=Shinella sp. M31 TaxID=3368615 RepID=UPI003B9F132A
MLLNSRALILSLSLFAGFVPSAASSQDKCDELQVAVATTPVIEQTPGKLKAARNSERLSGPAGLLIVGDSIAANWKESSITDFPGQAVKIYGVRGERTQELLWRLQNHAPKVLPQNILLVIGTNNLSDRTSEPCGVSSGIEAAVGVMRKLWPAAKILVLPILPRGEGYMFRDTDRQEVNSLLRARFSGDDLIKVLEIDEKELTCAGHAIICGNFRRDNLHPTDHGYVVLSQAIAANLISHK